MGRDGQIDRCRDIDDLALSIIVGIVQHLGTFSPGTREITVMRYNLHLKDSGENRRSKEPASESGSRKSLVIESWWPQ